MKITGELLKSERVNKNLSVQDVAVALKLSSKIITALEAGDINALPAKTFVRGFVKSYAEFLKLDPVVVLRQFQEEMGTTSPLPKVPPPQAAAPGENIKASRPAIRHTSQSHSQNDPVKTSPLQQKKLRENNLNNKIVIFLTAAILLVAVLVISAKLFNSINSDTVVASREEDDSSAPIVPNYDLDPASLAVSTDASTNSDKTPSVTPTASSAASTDSRPAASQDSTAAVAATEEEFQPSAGKPVELIIEAKKDVEIYYAKGNTKQFKILKIPQHQLQIIKSNTGLHLKASDGGSIKLTVNGVDIGFAGLNNKQVKLSF